MKFLPPKADRWFTVLTVIALAIGFPLQYLNAMEARIWLYPGANFGLDRDDYLIRRCGSGAQNIFYFPVLELLLAFCVCICIAWLLRRVLRFVINDIQMTKRDLAAERARELQRRKICAACGYDIRATPGRCPECGTPVGTPGS